MAVLFFFSYTFLQEEAKEGENNMESAISAMEKMRVGWNLGNSLDCCGIGNVKKTGAAVSEYEKLWGNPVADKKLIRRIRELGYCAVRLPVTWYEHMDEKAGVDQAWMRRVRELADMVLEEGMYCILNVHHDAGAGRGAWLRADKNIYGAVRSRFIRLWEQIAESFEQYGEEMLFEGFNEMLDVSSDWDDTEAENYRCINCYHQDFVDTVRSFGGRHAQRNLILNTYSASPMEAAAKHFVLPEDSSEGHLIAGVHFYKPDAFSAGDRERFDADAEREVDAFFERMKRYFTEKGIPVLLGECGTHDIRTERERSRYAKYVIEKAVENKMAYFWWDDGEKMKLIDRMSLEVVYQNLQQEIMRAAWKGRER